MSAISLQEQRRRRLVNNGSALVITLSFLVIIAVLLTGFVVTARVERTTAASYLAGSQAALMAKIGIDTASARLLKATEAGQLWASAPGRLFAFDAQSPNAAPAMLELSSGGVDGVEKDVSVNLNLPSLLSSEGDILGNGSIPFSVRWIYQRRDGTLETGETPPGVVAGNPATGRFAFWVDDESCKINWNTAGMRAGSGLPISHPGRIDLTAITPMGDIDVERVESFRLNRHWFHSPLELFSVDSENVAEAARQEKFSFTHYNHSPDANVFNEPRVALTTSKALAGEHPYFDIVKPNGDPALLADLDPAKVAACFEMLYTHLSRGDWPFLVGQSFVDKYTPEGAAQIALNMIEYVRGASSPSVIVEPLRGSFDAAKGSFKLDGNSLSYLGFSRKPYIVQMAANVSRHSTGTWQCEYAVQLWLPPWNGAQTCDLLGFSLYLLRPDGSSATSAVTKAEVHGGVTTFGPGEYRTIIRKINLSGEPANPIPLRAALINVSTGNRLDIAPISNDSIAYTYITPAASSVLDVPSVAVDDPLINKLKESWTRIEINKLVRAVGEATDASTLGSASTAIPQQDTDADGAITAAGERMPAPASGVGSVGELGYIHTGGLGPAVAGIPWRTLRLQPRQSNATGVPDWALLDLFTAPVPNVSARQKAMLEPRPMVVGGRVNLNVSLYPFVDSASGFERLEPLKALLLNANDGFGQITEGQAAQLASAIARQTPSDGANPGNFHFVNGGASSHFYLTPGQLAEVKGIADSGEQSEALLQGLLGLVTVRSNVYSIYSLGQSVRQLPSGAIIVTGEKKVHALIERTEGGNIRLFSRRNLDL